MKNLLRKEFRLAMHPTSPMFLALSAMVLIPNYPYYVVFFYTSLAVFFTCLSGRENQDIDYTMNLPVRKRDIVRARFTYILILELAQVALAVPLCALRGRIGEPNLVGMDANTAFIGLSLGMLGLFNLCFFTRYYKNVQKVGYAFAISSTAIGVYMVACEICAHALPFFRDVLDTPDPAHMPEKLCVLGIGAAAFCLATALAYRRSVASFEAQDL